MYAYDFEYDGRLLSEFGMMVCSFSNDSGANTADSGSEITFNLVPAGYGQSNYVSGLKYEKCLSTTFQICKIPDVRHEDDAEISNEELRELSRWLNRKKFLWFNSFDWCEPDRVKPWFRASFTLKRIESGRQTVGVELDMVTDAPFGYGPEESLELTFLSAGSKQMVDRSDEIGETCPWMQVTCGTAGDLVLTDDITGCRCSVANCLTGEVLTFSGDSRLITSTNTNHDLANDFNYDFFRFGNTVDERINTITASMPCTVVMKYRPIWKDTL